MIKKIIIFILILGVLVGILGFYYYQKNRYSKEILKLEILGAEEVQAFEETEFLVRYKNNGETTLEEPELIFQYPKNSLSLSENSQRVTKKLEDIYPGQEKTISFKARLPGKENEVKQAEATLRYRPKNLKAFYESKTTFTSKIKYVPLNFQLDLPSKIEAGREIQFLLNYFSSSEWPLSNLRVKIEYPNGFEFLSSRPQALDRSEWDLSLLNKAEGGRIEIKGKLLGETKEQKIFRATLGIWQEGEFILLKEVIKGTEIQKPALSVFQHINGVSQYIANPGDILHFEIFFRNIGEESFQDLFLVSKLEGTTLDFSSIKTERGQIQAGENSIIWDWRDVPKLRFLGQGEEGKVEFWISLRRDWEETSFQGKNLTVKNKVILSQLTDEIETKISSKLGIFQKGYFNDEIFGNSGPLPPEAGSTTTYTVIWQAKNYYNDVKDVKVKATLPSQAKLTGRISPEDAKLTFDSQSGEIVWEIGDMEKGKGVLSPAPNVAFQVALTPDFSQKGRPAEITGKAKISGEDIWAEITITEIIPGLDTTLPDDETITDKMGIVQ